MDQHEPTPRRGGGERREEEEGGKGGRMMMEGKEEGGGRRGAFITCNDVCTFEHFVLCVHVYQTCTHNCDGRNSNVASLLHV